MATTTTTRLRLSPHFVIEEFDGHDPAQTHVPAAAIPAVQELCVHLLEPMRETFGPCTVTTGLRPRRPGGGEIGGVPKSQHRYDVSPDSVAADVRFRDGSVAQWAATAKSIFSNDQHWTAKHRGGVGDNPALGIVHVDSGPRRDFHD